MQGKKNQNTFFCILSTSRFEIHNGNILRLFRVKEEDEGTYTCTSENSVGKTEASAMLQVHGKSGLPQTGSQPAGKASGALKSGGGPPFHGNSVACFCISASWPVLLQQPCEELMLNRMDYAI